MAVIGAIFSAIAGAYTAITATAVGAFLTRVVLSVALSALSAALQKKPSSGGISGSEITAGDTEPQKIVVGAYATAGAMIAPHYSFDYNGSKDLKYLTTITSLADYPITDITRVIIDGKYYNILGREAAATSPLGYTVDGELNGYVFIRFHDGNQTTADDFLVSSFAAYPNRPWTANHKLIGISYAVMTYKYKAKKFSGEPNVRFEIKGSKLYDIRKDSTAGGLGSHRFADKSTWEFTTNPIVQVYNINRGITLADGNVYGIGAAAETMPFTIWAAAMAVCDEQGSEPSATGLFADTKRYQAGLEFSLEDEPLAVIEELLSACGGQLTEVGGYYSVAVGPPQFAAIGITDDNVIISEATDFKMHNSLSETFNAIHANYPSPEHLWETRDAEPAYFPEWELEDDNRRLIADLKLSSVPYPKQVRRLMLENIQDNRRARLHNVVLGPWSLNLIPLDVISWTSAKNNYTNKKFEIISKVTDPATLNSQFALKERDPTDYDADNVFISIIPGYTNTDQVKPIIAGVTGFAAYPVAINNDTGKSKRAAIRIEWDADMHYDSLNYEITNTVTLLQETGSVIDIEAGQVVVAGGILPNSNYNIRVIAKIAGRDAEWSSAINITTPDINIDFDDFEPSVEQQILDAILAGEVSAAAVAAADAAEAAAVAAQVLAQTAANNANASFIATNTAVGVALGHANNAAISANNSNASALAANTAKGLALGYANSANTYMLSANAFAISANTAKIAAETAKTASETARNQAQTYANNANNSAVASAGSASAANTSATDAGNSASAAQAFVITAGSAANSALFSANAAATSATSAATFANNSSQSAIAAANSALQANTSRGQASTFANNAATSASAANTSASAALISQGASATSATAANTSANAAATSASSAATSANNSNQSALAAANSALQANTSRGDALTFSSQAATSATAANTSAANAFISQGAAANSANLAGNSASAAAGSAATASTQANNSNTSAVAAAASAVTANTAAGNASTSASQAASSASSANTFATQASTSANTAATVLSNTQRALNSTTAIITSIPNSDLMNFGTTASGTVDNYTVYVASNYLNDADGNYVRRTSTASLTAIYLKNVVNCVDGNVYRVTIKVKANADMSLRIRASFITADGSSVVNGGYKTTSIIAANGVQTLSMIFGRTAGGIVDQIGGTLSNWTTASYIRFGVDVLTGVAASEFSVYSIVVDDVTQIDLSARQAGLSAGSAAAALVSESNAAAFANSASSYASAANTSRISANTSAGNALIYSNQSANSATNAANSASQASLSQTASANSANTAATQANTAAGFAASAAISSNSSSTSATAAAASATAANTSAGSAATSASQASVAAGNASSFAASAATASNTSVTALSDVQRALNNTTAILTTVPIAALNAFGISGTGTIEGYTPIGVGSYSSDVDGPYVKRGTAGAGAGIWLRNMVSAADLGVYRVTIKVKTTVDVSLRMRAVFIAADGSQASVGTTTFKTAAATANTLTTYSMIFGRVAGGIVDQVGGTVATWINTNQIRFGIDNLTAVTGGEFWVYEIKVEDVTAADLAARSQILSGNSASAAATSATAAAVSANNSNQSATAAALSATAANTSAGSAGTFASQASASAANSSASASQAASSAGVSATSQIAANNAMIAANNFMNAANASMIAANGFMNTANTHKNSANGYAIAAANSASLANTYANDAGVFSASAMDYRDTAAKTVYSGASRNPVFNDWSGSLPNNVTITLGTGTVTKDTTNAKYLNSLVFTTNATTPAGSPIIQLVATTNTPDSTVNPSAIETRIELAYVSGNTIGTVLRAGWQKTSDSVWVYVDISLTSEIELTAGKIQNLEIYIERPASLAGVAVKNFNLLIYPTATLPAIGASVAVCSLRLHKFDYQVVTGKSATAIWQASKVSIDKVATAAVGLRAVAGTGGAQLELVALSDPILGTTSTARISANNIILAGTVKGDHIQANTISTDKLYANSLSSISATIGILRTATSGQRTELHSDKFLVYDASGVLRVKIGNLA